MNTQSTPLQSILLVDDDHSNNFLNKIFINQLNLDVEVDIALNGQEALDYIETSFIGPCLLILDLRMPIMNGWEFLQAYEKEVPEEIKKQIVIVVITISTDKADADKARKSRYVEHFVQKPLSDLKFKKLIKKFFDITA
ncbi:response regulator [bacterium]|nr:response regulator [bacterium]